MTLQQILFYDTSETEYDISLYVYSISINRGRALELDVIDPGTCVLVVNNQDRDFDPYFVVGQGNWLQGNGDDVLQGNGDNLLFTLSSNVVGGFGAMEQGRRIIVKDDGVVVFTGVVEDYDYQWTPDGAAIAILECVDALGALGQAELDEWQTTAHQLPGPRLAAMMSRPEVAYPTGAGFRDLDTGINTLQGDLVATGTFALPYGQLVALSDLGRFFADRDDVITYRDRTSTRGVAAAVAFGTGGVNIRQVGVRFGSEQLHFRVSVTRLGGETKTAVNQEAIDSNPRRGARGRSITGLLTDHDAYSESTAEYLVDRLSSPFAVVSNLVVVLNELAERNTVAALEINDVVTLSWTPTCEGLSVFQTLTVEGIAYEVSREDRQVRMTFHLSSLDQTTYYKIEDADYGLIDDPGVVLAP